MKRALHVVCYSGGHSSAMVAVEVVRRFGTEDVVLLNHDIHASVEDADIKRFKREIAERLELPVTYANHERVASMDQFDIVVEAKAFKVGHNQQALCTHRLKTEPFMRWLDEHADPAGTVIYYGFDAKERERIQRRSSILAAQGWRSDYPLALWPRTIASSAELGIAPPLTYSQWKHANCVGCLKGKRQHWYVVFVTRPDVWAKAKAAEDTIGYTILPDISLEEIEPMFTKMHELGVPATERIPYARFWADAKRKVKLAMIAPTEEDDRPCECVV